MEIEFCDLSYTVKKYLNVVGEKKTILKNVSGKFVPGELCAILGSSGAGKTTLLHAVSGYKKMGVSGALLINSELRDERWFRRRSCYITQEDTLPGWMSVREALRLAARLKRGGGEAERERACQELLDYLGLRECADTRTERLSGGQRKRTAVALELVGGGGGACFLDEPCSGLDDVAAARTQRLLRRLAEHGRTVAVTLHQPSASALALYHRLYVVAAGRCIYHGPPAALVGFLSQNGFHCPLTHNPADYIIELVDSNPQMITRLSESIENGKIFFTDSTSSAKQEIAPTSITNYEITFQDSNWLMPNNNSVEKEQEHNYRYPISGFEQFTILLQRYLRNTMRNKHSLFIQAVHYALCAFLVASCFYNTADNGALMFNHLKCNVGLALFFSYTRFLAPIIMIPGEIKMAKKENFNRWYGTTPYFFASTVASIPVQFLYNSIFIAIVYYFVGMPLEIWRFSMFVIIGNMLSFATDGLGVAVASIFRPLIGLVIGPSMSSVFLGLAIYGFDFAKQIPDIMLWLMRSSPTRVGLSSFVVVSFGWGRKRLRCEEVFCFFADPQKLLDFVGGADSDLYRELGCLFALMVAFRIVAFLALKWRFKYR